MESGSLFDDAKEIVLEVKFGEGGDDSKLFVVELFTAYAKYAARNGFQVEILNSEPGHILAKMTGANVFKSFSPEIGQHVCQRVPDTERSGRRHTSVVAVAVLPIKLDLYKPLPMEDVDITTQCGRLTAGGQHRQRSHTAVRAVHVPTKIQVFIQSERSQAQNKETAIRILTARVNDLWQSKEDQRYNQFKQEVLGDGRRGAKIRTYNFISMRASDHRTGIKTSQIDKIFNGHIELLR